MSEQNQMSVEIILTGCDDTTRFHVMVDQAGLDLLRQVAEKSVKASDYACQPVMEVGAPF